MSGMSRRSLILRCLLALLALSAAVGALLYPTEAVLNAVGGVLIALQVAALAILLNPQARGRLVSGVFLVVSGVHTYWWYWVPYSSNGVYLEWQFWRSPVTGVWQWLHEWRSGPYFR